MRSRGEEGTASGGVLHHGTLEEDGPVTWEALVSPREFPVLRRAGDPSPKPVRLQVHAPAAEAQPSAEQAPAPGGRPRARGTEATAEGGKGVGGLHRSFDVGELVGNSDPAEQRRPVLM